MKGEKAMVEKMSSELDRTEMAAQEIADFLKGINVGQTIKVVHCSQIGRTNLDPSTFVSAVRDKRSIQHGKTMNIVVRLNYNYEIQPRFDGDGNIVGWSLICSVGELGKIIKVVEQK